MKEERIMTLHPKGKKGVNVLKRRYDLISDFIIGTVKKRKEITFQKLTKLALDELKDSFDGKIVWYMVTIKLDLEARNIIERIPKTSSHKLKLKTGQ